MTSIPATGAISPWRSGNVPLQNRWRRWLVKLALPSPMTWAWERFQIIFRGINGCQSVVRVLWHVYLSIYGVFIPAGASEGVEVAKVCESAILGRAMSALHDVAQNRHQALRDSYSHFLPISDSPRRCLFISFFWKTEGEREGTPTTLCNGHDLRG